LDPVFLSLLPALLAKGADDHSRHA
jgi:hypothetical protein